MDTNAFRKYAHEVVDWIADYYETIDKYPVKAQINPGDVFKMLEDKIPQEGEPMEVIFKDFQDIIIPGITKPI